MSAWIFLIVVVLVLWLYLPRLGWIAIDDAREQLKAGALLLDVRSARECSEQPVKGAENIPVDELVAAIEGGALSKDRPILLFCASGMRSGAAKRTLRTYGFTQVENLGTVTRADAATGKE